MQAQRIVVAIGAVALVAVVAVGARLDGLQPVAPVGDVAGGGPSLPTSQDQSVLARVGVNPEDLGPGYQADLMDQGDRLTQPTLDLCDLHFASEARRQARRQVVVSDSTGEPLFSTEAVLYQTQAGAAEAMGEVRGAASRCRRWRIQGAGDLGGEPPTGVDRVGLTVDPSPGGPSADQEVLVFIRRGRLMIGLYFVQAAGPQAVIDGRSTIGSTVGVFQDRVAALPGSDLR